MYLMQSARKQYQSIVSTLRTRRVLHSTTPNEAFINFSPGEQVLVYRDKTGPDGPYTFLYRDERLSIFLDQQGYEHLFHGTMLKA